MTSEMNNLITLIETLRGENGCPWDKQQTPHTMVLYLIEEVYELVSAIESGRPDAIREELGDVLFQVFFIARLYGEMGHFDIQQVAQLCVDKMIRRHPHIFAGENLQSAEEVKVQWHHIKNKEKKNNEKESVLDSIPQKLPALMRAYRISERAASSGFDWNTIKDVIEKVKEEWQEFIEALDGNKQNEDHKERVALEFGDILFTLVNVARFAQIHPETALTSAITKFEYRFRKMEMILSEQGEDVASASMTKLNDLWVLVKKQL